MAISWYPTDNSQDGQLYLVSTVCHSVVGSPSFILETKGQNKQQSLYCSAQVAAKSGKTYSVFLSSEYERSQWVEALRVLQEKLPPNTSQAHTLSMVELQSWVTSCRKFLKTNMGSFLMRSTRDEPLLVGDLHLKLQQLSGLTRPANIFIVIEVDSYGHFFRKVKTRVVCGSLEPTWNEEFIIELEGSENVRVLVYEEAMAGQQVIFVPYCTERPKQHRCPLQDHPAALRGKAVLELSRNWLSAQYSQQRIAMSDVADVLTCQAKFLAFEVRKQSSHLQIHHRTQPANKTSQHLNGTLNCH